MQAGRLNQRVTLLRSDKGISATGSRLPIEDFVHEATVWAQVTPVNGSEAFLSQQRIAGTTHVVRMRFRDDVDPSWRLEWRGLQMNILEIIPGGQQLREYLEVRARASDAENPVD